MVLLGVQKISCNRFEDGGAGEVAARDFYSWIGGSGFWVLVMREEGE